jgi:hypothetical protein
MKITFKTNTGQWQEFTPFDYKAILNTPAWISFALLTRHSPVVVMEHKEIYACSKVLLEKVRRKHKKSNSFDAIIAKLGKEECPLWQVMELTESEVKVLTK